MTPPHHAPGRISEVAMPEPGETTPAILKSWPGIRHIPSQKVELFTAPGFAPPELCHRLMALIDANRRPSTIADPNGDNDFRTSETCDLDPADPAVAMLEGLLSALNRIDPAHGEPLQGQRYETGQEFKAHTDWFNPGGAGYATYCSLAGQRTWTFMIYLNAVEAGGATRFREIGKTFQPEQGRLLAWNNRLPGGRGNPDTLHHAMKVRKGRKYVITKWYREKPWS